MMDLTTGAGYSFGRVLRLLRAELGNHAGLLYEPLYANRLQNTILSGLLLTAEHQYRAELTAPARPSRPRTVKRAIDAMEAEPGHPFTTVRLAEIAGVSIRTLQEAFQQHVGISPMVYLRQVRLARAHLDLCAADPRQATVADVAHRWGFSHLGRFAAAYRSAYGDSPATTLRRPA